MSSRADELDAALGALRTSESNERVEQAWSKIYRELWPYAYAIAYRSLGGDAESAKDATQDAFVRLARSVAVHHLENTAQLRRYFAVVVRHSAADWFRREHRRAHLAREVDLAIAHFVPDASPAADDLIESDEVLSMVRRELSSQDATLLTRVIDGDSLDEIATDLKVNHGALRVRLHRLRRRIRKAMESSGDN